MRGKVVEEGSSTRTGPERDPGASRRNYSSTLLRRIKQPTPSYVWPESLKLSYLHDLSSVYPGSTDLGYRIAYHTRMARTINYVRD